MFNTDIPSQEEIQDHIVHTYRSMIRILSDQDRGLITNEEMDRLFSDTYIEGFQQYLRDHGILLSFIKKNWSQFVNSYRQWLQGLAPESESSFFDLMTAFCLPVEYFEPAPDDAVFDERSFGIPAVSGLECTIHSRWADNDHLLEDPAPVGKTFRIVSDLGLKAEITVTGRASDDYGRPMFYGEGTIEGYVANPKKELRICVGRDSNIESIAYAETGEDVKYYRSFPLWKTAVKYYETNDQILKKSMARLAQQLDCYRKAQ